MKHIFIENVHKQPIYNINNVFNKFISLAQHVRLIQVVFVSIMCTVDVSAIAAHEAEEEEHSRHNLEGTPAQATKEALILSEGVNKCLSRCFAAAQINNCHHKDPVEGTIINTVNKAVDWKRRWNWQPGIANTERK